MKIPTGLFQVKVFLGIFPGSGHTEDTVQLTESFGAQDSTGIGTADDVAEPAMEDKGVRSGSTLPR